MNLPSIVNRSSAAGQRALEGMRALVTALIMILMVAGSTAVSPLFVVYRQEWGITSADIAIVFSVYVGTLLPMLIFFGGLAERFGRRRIAAAGIGSMFFGLALIAFANNLPMLVIARLFQGAGVGISIGALSAALTEAYKGKFPIGTVMQTVASVGLFTGPVISAIAFNLGGGVSLSYVPTLVLVGSLLALVPLIVERPMNPVTAQPSDVPFAPEVVANALRFALPVAFVSWAGLSLFLSLVPSYLAATLHAANPAIGAGAVVASQVAALAANFSLRNLTAERGGTFGSIVSIVGLALLVWGTSADIWLLVAIATLFVGGGAGIASSSAFGIAARIGRGHRAKVYARMYVAAYAGYSIPVLAIGLIAVHASLAIAFIVVTMGLAVVTAILPALVSGRNRNLVPQDDLLPRAA